MHIEKADLHPKVGIPRKYVERIKGLEITYNEKPATVIEKKVPSKCPHCSHKMHYEHIGCDGDFCFGFFFCPNHQEEVYPSASGPH